MADKKRMSITLSEDATKTLAEMANEQGVSIVDVIRRSVKVTKTLMETEKEGGKVLLLDSEGNKAQLIFH